MKKSLARVLSSFLLSIKQMSRLVPIALIRHASRATFPHALLWRKALPAADPHPSSASQRSLPTLCFGGRPCWRRSWGLTLLCKEGLREVSFIQRDIEIPPAPLYERGLFLLPLYGGCLKTIKLPKYKLTVIGKKLEIARITQPPTPNPEPRCLSIQTATTKRGVDITPLL